MIKPLTTYFSNRQWHMLALAVLGASLCYSPAIVTICQIVLVTNWLAEGDLPAKFRRLWTNKWALSIIGIYALHLAGLLHSSNLSYAFFDLKIKLPLLILPLVVGSTEPFDKKEFQFLLNAFVCGTALVTAYSMFIYFGFTNVHIELNNTTYSHTNLRLLSPFISHIRYSLMVALSAILAGYLAFKTSTWMHKSGWMLLSLWFVLFLGLMGVRAGIICFFAALFVLTIYAIVVLKNKRLYIVLTLLVILLPIFIYTQTVGTRIGFSEAMWEMNYYSQGGNPSGHSIPQRLEYWKAAVELIKEHPFIGVGTGDIKDAINQYYETTATRLDPSAYNRPHNEYLSISISLGLIGTFLFVCCLFFPLLYRRTWKNNALFLCFWTIMILSMLTEDTIETQAGVTFFAFFSTLLIHKKALLFAHE